MEVGANEISLESFAFVDKSEYCGTCPICFEIWTVRSEMHKPVALKCGHLFGDSCIQSWLNESGSRYCPTCMSEASPNDIRRIYGWDEKPNRSEEIRLKKVVEDLHTQLEELQLKYLEIQHNFAAYREETMRQTRSRRNSS